MGMYDEKRWYHDPDYTFRTLRGGVIAALIALGLAALVGISVLIAFFTSRASCNSYSTQTQRETRWDFHGGCYVQTDSGRWISRDTYDTIHLEGERP